MIRTFGYLRTLLEADNAITVDHNVFRLHCKATVILLALFSTFVTCRQYIGDPIDCLVDGVPSHVMDNYCWTYSTFTVTKRAPSTDGHYYDPAVVHYGLGPYEDGKDEVKYHKYYQWVCFVLFFQAVMFYVPRYVWKVWEGGRMGALVMGLVVDGAVPDDRCRRRLAVYIAGHLGAHNYYATRFFVCELLNFVNLVGQMYLTNSFLDGEFRTYGYDVLRFIEMPPERRADPMARIFPKIAKCSFYQYGGSGTVEKFDGLCVLPLNVVNEKIYVFLWFWFYFLAVLDLLNFMYRVAVLRSPAFRLLLLKARSRLCRRHELETVFKELDIGDWFVLFYLAKYIEPNVYADVISELATTFDGNA